MSKCQCWRQLPSSEKTFVVKMAAFTLFFITSVILLDTSHPNDSGSSRVRFWTGLGLFALGVIAVWWTTSSFMHTLLTQATAKAKDRNITYIETSMLYYPIYITTVYVMASYALFLIFRLDDWNLAMGAFLLFVTMALLLLFMFESGRGIMKLAKTYNSDAFDTLSNVTPAKLAYSDGTDQQKTRSMKNAQFALAKSKREVAPQPPPVQPQLPPVQPQLPPVQPQPIAKKPRPQPVTRAQPQPKPQPVQPVAQPQPVAPPPRPRPQRTPVRRPRPTAVKVPSPRSKPVARKPTTRSDDKEHEQEPFARKPTTRSDDKEPVARKPATRSEPVARKPTTRSKPAARKPTTRSDDKEHETGVD